METSGSSEMSVFVHQDVRCHFPEDSYFLRIFFRVLRKILGSKRDEVTGEWRRLHSEELYALYASANIIWLIESRRMTWHTYGERERCSVLMGMPEGRRTFGRPRRRWRIILTCIFNKWGGVAWTGLIWFGIRTGRGNL
jgi:hypothetical protein